MKKTGFNGYVYDFRADYNDTDIDDKVDIHKYLIKKWHSVTKCLRWLKNFKFNTSLMGVDSLSCISMNNHKWKVTPQIVKVNSDLPVFFLFKIKASKCSGSCNNVNDPYAKMCVPDVNVFNLMSRTNEARHIKWHETSKCKCRLDRSICNNKQRWNVDKCRYECK